MNEDNSNGKGKFFDRSNLGEAVNNNDGAENQNNVFFNYNLLFNASNNLEGQNSENVSSSQDIDSNKENAEQYQYIIDNAKKNDVYWDRNNIFVKAILIALFSFAVVGTVCFFLLWLIEK